MRVFRAPLVLAFAVGMLLGACDEPERVGPTPVQTPTVKQAPVDSSAVAIVERARRVHGADVLDHAAVAFTFRGARFTVERDDGRFVYSRTGANASPVVRDTLSNEGFGRTVDGVPVPLSERDRLAGEEVVNSVIYFALLPYALADEAVQLRLLGSDSLRSEPYDLVEVTFRPEGGGRDYQDRFLYWIHRDHSTVDYLAYSYVVSGGGARFREAYNPRTVGGVRFADYRNYSAEPLEPSLERMGRMFEADSLELLSEIVLEEVAVAPLTE